MCDFCYLKNNRDHSKIKHNQFSFLLYFIIHTAKQLALLLAMTLQKRSDAFFQKFSELFFNSAISEVC